MSMMPVWPTCRGWLMLAASVASLLNAMVNPNLASFLFCAGVCSVVLSSTTLCAFSLRKLSLRREIGRDGVKGGVVPLPLTISSEGRLSRQALLLREVEGFSGLPVFDTVVDPLLPGEIRHVSRMPVARRRGRFKLCDVMALGGDPAGLFRRTRTFALPDELLIRPETVRIAWMPIRVKGRIQASPAGRNAGSAGFGQEFFGVREYRISDGFRFIHWKASAKQGKLMIREFEEQDIPQVSIIMDCCAKDVGQDPLENNFETLVKLAASMADYLGGLYCKLAFVCGGDAKSGAKVSAASGLAFGLKRDVTDILTELAPSDVSVLELIDASMDMHPPGSILYLLTMSVPKDIEPRLEALFANDVEVRWILCPKELFPVGGEGSPDPESCRVSDSLRPQPLICGPGTNISSLLEYG